MAKYGFMGEEAYSDEEEEGQQDEQSQDGTSAVDEKAALADIDNANSPEQLKAVLEKYDMPATNNIFPENGNKKEESSNNATGADDKTGAEPDAKTEDNSAAATTEANETGAEKTDKEGGSTEGKETPDVQTEGPDKGQSEEVAAMDKAIITDALIDSFPPEDRAMLRTFKGKPLGEVLRSYVNAQKLIGKRKEDLINSGFGKQFQQAAKPAAENKLTNSDNTAEQSNNDGTQPEQSNTTNGVDNLKEQMILNQFKAQFPDLKAGNMAELRESVTELNYTDRLKCDKVVNALNQIESEVQADYEQFEYVQNNHAELNKNEISNQIAQITDYAKSINIDLKSDLGIDLTLDSEGQNAFVNKLLSDSNGQVDSNLVHYIGNVPLVRPEAILNKFLQTQLPAVLKVAATKGRTSGFQAANEARAKMPATMASAPAAGKQGGLDMSIDDISQINDISQLRDIQRNLENRI